MKKNKNTTNEQDYFLEKCREMYKNGQSIKDKRLELEAKETESLINRIKSGFDVISNVTIGDI